jgi:hypothetical protein
MSTNNPQGWKLEDLLVQLIAELNEKNQKAREEGPSEAFDMVVRNNSLIIEGLSLIVGLQHQTMRKLRTAHGPNRGPEHPRHAPDLNHEQQDGDIDF